MILVIAATALPRELPVLLATLAAGAAGALPDTVVTVQAGAQGFARVLSVLQSVASVIIAIALIAIAIPLIPAAWNSRKMYKRINETFIRFRGDFDPILKHAAALADNLDYISTSVRVDVQQLNQTVAAANQRLNRAAVLAEERVNEFNALLQVVQEEAEDLFIGTAATLRGMRVGAEAFQRFQHAPADAERDRLDDDGYDDGMLEDDDEDLRAGEDDELP